MTDYTIDVTVTAEWTVITTVTADNEDAAFAAAEDAAVMVSDLDLADATVRVNAVGILVASQE